VENINDFAGRVALPVVLGGHIGGVVIFIGVFNQELDVVERSKGRKGWKRESLKRREAEESSGHVGSSKTVKLPRFFFSLFRC
jgi:hypothetical protein